MSEPLPPHTRRTVKMRQRALEDAVMDRFEAGETAETIAVALAVNPRTVKSVIDYMREGRPDHLHSRTMLAIASKHLLAAIARHHPERIA